MDTKEEEEFAWAMKEFGKLRNSVRSCILATASSSGKPLSSYAPVFVDELGDYFIYVSAMAKHFTHLRKTGLASLSLIEDESAADELFARKRVTIDCLATLLKRDSDEWEKGIAGLESRHGATMGYLKGLVDFDLFRLRPDEGRLVLGFGKAYRVFGVALSDISYLGAGGHRSKK